MWYANRSKLSKEVLDPLEGYLQSLGHIGDVDVNCIVDDEGKAWPLEFTCRLGWPAFYIMTSQHEEPCQWMLDALNGKDTLTVHEGVYIGVVLTHGRFPFNGGSKSDVTGIPIEGITDGIWPQIHLADAMAGKGVEMKGDKPVEKDMIVTAGEYVMCVTGSGETVRKARKDVYAVAERISFPDYNCRDDVGEDFVKDLPELQAHGYATDVEA